MRSGYKRPHYQCNYTGFNLTQLATINSILTVVLIETRSPRLDNNQPLTIYQLIRLQITSERVLSLGQTDKHNIHHTQHTILSIRNLMGGVSRMASRLSI